MDVGNEGDDPDDIDPPVDDSLIAELRFAITKRLIELELQAAGGADFTLTLATETPRGKLLVTAQFVDVLLTRLITGACINLRAAGELLGDSRKPLGTLSSKILAAYAFGLLSDELFWNLERLR